MNPSIKKYLLFSSVFAIFTEAFFFNYIIDWKLLYLIIILNYALLAVTQKKLRVNKYFMFLLIGLFIHGAITSLLVGVPPNLMISQIIGISIVGIYYYNFIPLFDKKEITSVYIKISLYVAILGYFLYFFKINLNDGRLQSIFKEPAHYVIVVLPACYYYLKQKQYLNFAIIFGTLILSNSSLGYIGCALMFIVPNISFRRVLYLFALIPVVVISFIYVYNEYSFFKMRVQETYDSLNVINTGKFDEKTNLSSYALISNLHIAKRNITDHPFGTGIGSHVFMHKKVYLKETRPPEYLRIQKKHYENATDANSLFTRMVSEMGIFGFILVLYLLYKSVKCFRSDELFLCQGIFIYFLLKLFRDGHYFPPELFFFIWLLYYSIKSYNNSKKIAV
ncbi:O-antigen ligase family protein [Flavobacterium cerinum]|uniref:O-antigen ligase family protein n=1 Tax=Flavobacterium cerinum TaxID=2502784 RepID=A0ABY5IY56_9FLAO|nr:O-antigen ligase family protein [Flavobacterium cerinum]UUC46279.1 O-antigen ligase family protein [Flavobacterium cerinum]